MSERYYIRFRGRVLGPFSAEKTTEMVRRGQVTRVHELSPDGLTWKKAEEFSEFFSKASSNRSTRSQSERNDDSSELQADSTVVAVPQWHVHFDGQEHGPIDESVLVDWVRQGKVRGDNMVWRAGMAEWMTAESVRPNWFITQATMASRVASNVSQASSNSSDEIDGRLLAETVGKTNWLYFLSVSITILGVLSAIGAGIWFLEGVAILRESRFLGTNKLLVGGMAGIQAALTLVCGVLLLRHANAVALLRAVPTMQNAIVAAQRLSLFWFVAGLYMLLLLGFISFGILIEMLTEASS